MGTDIHVMVERPRAGQWQIVPEFQPFNWRNYGHFAFLADVRNYSGVPCITPCRGVPEDASYPEFFEGYHSCSWLLVQELLAWGYDAEVEDRRYFGTGPTHGVWYGNLTAEPGRGKKMRWREFLGEAFMFDLQELREIAPDGRIIFGFDS